MASQERWDCHAHVIENRERYPLSPNRGYDPPDAPLEHYLEMLDRHGLARGVLVQPSIFGFDNRCMLAALDRADGRLLGVAVPAPDTTAAELEVMHRRGVRGVRCNLLNPGGLDPAVVLEWQPVLRDLGWHVAFHVDIEEIGDPGAYLGRFDVPVVIDHMGSPFAARPREEDPGEMLAPTGELDPSSPGFRRLVELTRAGACYVKLSAPYRLSHVVPPWPDVTPLARALLEANPGACLWATDWPHTDTRTPVREEDLIRALADWCPEPERRRTVLVDTPAKLLGTDSQNGL